MKASAASAAFGFASATNCRYVAICRHQASSKAPGALRSAAEMAWNAALYQASRLSCGMAAATIRSSNGFRRALAAVIVAVALGSAAAAFAAGAAAGVAVLGVAPPAAALAWSSSFCQRVVKSLVVVSCRAFHSMAGAFQAVICLELA